jgi:hypothetical protein
MDRNISSSSSSNLSSSQSNINRPAGSVLHSHDNLHGVSSTMGQSLPASSNLSSSSSTISSSAAPLSSKYDANLQQSNFVASQLGSRSDMTEGQYYQSNNYWIGQDFYTPQVGLKGLKVSPGRRQMLDLISNKKWKLKNPPKDSVRDRSAPMLKMRTFVQPPMSKQYREFLDTINNKKWKKLSTPPKDRMRDRSAANLALWREEKGLINADYDKKNEKHLEKNAYKSDFYRPVSTKVESAPVSNCTSATGTGTGYGYAGQGYGTAGPLGHAHSEMNSAFPVSEQGIRSHQDVEGAAFRGATVGEKFSNLGRSFANWVKEEATEIKESVRTLGKHDHYDRANLGSGASQNVIPPGSSVQSGLPGQTAVGPSSDVKYADTSRTAPTTSSNVRTTSAHNDKTY